MMNKKNKFDFIQFTANVVSILDYVTEFAVGYMIYKLTYSIVSGIFGIMFLEIAYSVWALCLMDQPVSLSNFSKEKATEKITELQPYWLLINTAICIILSRMY